MFPINFWNSPKKHLIFFQKIFKMWPKNSRNNSNKFLKFSEKIFGIQRLISNILKCKKKSKENEKKNLGKAR